MDVELLRVVVPAAAGLIAAFLQLPSVTKVMGELKHRLRERRQKDSEFAAKVAEQTGDSDVAGFARELAYAALVGDTNLVTAERRFLISLQNRERVIASFLRTQQWVRIDLDARRLVWKKKRHHSDAYRNLARWGYVCGYLLWAFFAGSPFILRELPGLNGIPASVFWSMAVWTLGCGVPGAAYCLRRWSLMDEAAKLIATQAPAADGEDAEKIAQAESTVVRLGDGKRRRVGGKSKG